MDKNSCIFDLSIVNGESRISFDYSKKYKDLFNSDEKVKLFIGQLKSLDFKKILTPYNPAIINAIKDIGDFEIYPIVPNVSQFIRDMTNYGLIGAGVQRLKRIKSLPKLTSLGITGLTHAHKILKKDFKAGVALMMHLEMLEFKQFNPKIIFLHEQMTDLALANNNMKFFKFLKHFVQKKYKADLGLI